MTHEALKIPSFALTEDKQRESCGRNEGKGGGGSYYL